MVETDKVRQETLTVKSDTEKVKDETSGVKDETEKVRKETLKAKENTEKMCIRDRCPLLIAQQVMRS